MSNYSSLPLNDDIDSSSSPNFSNYRSVTTPSSSLLNSIFSFFSSSYILPVYPLNNTKKFQEEFSQVYDPYKKLKFNEESLINLIKLAYNQNKLFLIYIHSSLHQDTNDFILKILLNNNFNDLILREDLLLWGGSIENAETYSLANELNVTSFPFLGLFMPINEEEIKLIERIDGFNKDVDSISSILNKLERKITQNQERLRENRIENEERIAAELLRREQDEAYERLIIEESIQLEEERILEEIKRQEERKIEEKNKIKEEIEKKRINKINYIKDNEKYNEKMKENDKNSATIKFILPYNKKITLNFSKFDKLEKVYNYFLVYFYDNGDQIKSFKLFKSFPKEEISDLKLTIDDYGLYPRGILVVEEDEDEDEEEEN